MAFILFKRAGEQTGPMTLNLFKGVVGLVLLLGTLALRGMLHLPPGVGWDDVGLLLACSSAPEAGTEVADLGPAPSEVDQADRVEGTEVLEPGPAPSDVSEGGGVEGTEETGDVGDVAGPVLVLDAPVDGAAVLVGAAVAFSGATSCADATVTFWADEQYLFGTLTGVQGPFQHRSAQCSRGYLPSRARRTGWGRATGP